MNAAHDTASHVDEYYDALGRADAGTFAASGMADEPPPNDEHDWRDDLSPEEEEAMYAAYQRQQRRDELAAIVANELRDIDAAGGFVAGLVVVSRAAEARRELARLSA